MKMTAVLYTVLYTSRCKGKIKSIITRRKTFINLWISRNPLLHRILAGLSSSGKLGGPEVKTSAPVSRRSWVWIPPESPVKFFSTDTRKALSIVRATLNQLFITRRKNFINLWISRNPLLHRILAGLSSSGKLGGPEVKTSAPVSRRSWVWIPPESPVKFFSTDTRKALSIVRATLNQLFITRRKNFINLWISRNPLLYKILAGLSCSVVERFNKTSVHE